MPEAKPAAATLHAAITLDGRLAAPAPLLVADGASRPVPPEELRALLLGGAVRALVLTVCPHVDGQHDAPTLSGPPNPEFFPRSLACRLLHMETRDGQCVLHYRVLRRARPEARDPGTKASTTK